MNYRGWRTFRGLEAELVGHYGRTWWASTARFWLWAFNGPVAKFRGAVPVEPGNCPFPPSLCLVLDSVRVHHDSDRVGRDNALPCVECRRNTARTMGWPSIHLAGHCVRYSVHRYRGGSYRMAASCPATHPMNVVLITATVCLTSE